VDKTGIVHAAIGKIDFGLEKLLENVASFVDTIQKLKPPASKGTYYRSIAVSSSMGPGVKVDPVYVKDLLSR
jgi:large subunit ribosomal protein L1